MAMMSPTEREELLSLGEQRVRINFNVEKNNVVDEIKGETAKLINTCEELKDKDPRLCALAQAAYEEAAMWAVKLATT